MVLLCFDDFAQNLKPVERASNRLSAEAPASGGFVIGSTIDKLIALSKPYSEQRDGIYRERILEHFLPKSKQTPKPLAYIEC